MGQNFAELSYFLFLEENKKIEIRIQKKTNIGRTEFSYFLFFVRERGKERDREINR